MVLVRIALISERAVPHFLVLLDNPKRAGVRSSAREPFPAPEATHRVHRTYVRPVDTNVPDLGQWLPLPRLDNAPVLHVLFL